MQILVPIEDADLVVADLLVTGEIKVAVCVAGLVVVRVKGHANGKGSQRQAKGFGWALPKRSTRWSIVVKDSYGL